MSDSLISRISNTGEEFNIKIGCMNIANAIRDETQNPLYPRIQEIGNMVKTQQPDVLVMLEAGRNSMGHTWTEMAAEIEKITNLVYIGIYLVNGTEAPFGKALFIDKKSVTYRTFERSWIGDTLYEKWEGDRYGSDIIKVNLYPVRDGKVIHLGELRV